MFVSLCSKALYMESRPRIQLELSQADKIAEILAWTMLITVWVAVLLNYSSLPDIIPVHRNASGDIDASGDKSAIFVEPAIATIFVAGLTFLNRFPHVFNYAVKITAENARRQYVAATRLIRYLKLGIVVISLIITITTIGAAYGGLTSGIWLLPCITGVIAAPVIYFGSKLLKK